MPIEGSRRPPVKPIRAVRNSDGSSSKKVRDNAKVNCINRQHFSSFAPTSSEKFRESKQKPAVLGNEELEALDPIVKKSGRKRSKKRSRATSDDEDYGRSSVKKRKTGIKGRTKPDTNNEANQRADMNPAHEKLETVKHYENGADNMYMKKTTEKRLLKISIHNGPQNETLKKTSEKKIMKTRPSKKIVDKNPPKDSVNKTSVNKSAQKTVIRKIVQKNPKPKFPMNQKSWKKKSLISKFLGSEVFNQTNLVPLKATEVELKDLRVNLKRCDDIVHEKTQRSLNSEPKSKRVEPDFLVNTKTNTTTTLEKFTDESQTSAEEYNHVKTNTDDVSIQSGIVKKRVSKHDSYSSEEIELIESSEGGTVAVFHCAFCNTCLVDLF